MPRVAVRNFSHFSPSLPYEGAVRPGHNVVACSVSDSTRCCGCARDRSKPNTEARLRFRYSEGARPTCALCLLPGAFTIGKDEPAYLEIGHVVGLSLFGSYSPLNVRAMHKTCNADAEHAGYPDLRPFVTLNTLGWPPLTRARAFASTPHARFVPSNLPTVEQMRAARADRVLADGTCLPF